MLHATGRSVGRLARPFGRLARRDQSSMTVDVTPTGIAVVRLDIVGEKQNTLSMELIGTPVPTPNAAR